MSKKIKDNIFGLDQLVKGIYKMLQNYFLI